MLKNSETQHDNQNVRERTFTVDQNFDGWRLDRFMANRMSRLSRSRAGEIAKFGDVSVTPPRKVKAGTRLRTGDVVVVREYLPTETVQDDEVVTLYEDDALIVLNKPSGMLVHEVGQTRQNTIQAYLQRLGLTQAEPTHRLDRDTSGVLMCAARRDVVPVMRETFATDHPDKVYRALVLDPDGHWEVGEHKTLTTPLGLDDTAKVGVRMGRGRLASTTHVHVLSRSGDLADLEVTIETGRQHQIRVHLAMEGTPIAGDKLYTYDDDFFIALYDRPEDPDLLSKLRFPRHALHAWKLGVAHPDTGEWMEFSAPLPRLFIGES